VVTGNCNRAFGEVAAEILKTERFQNFIGDQATLFSSFYLLLAFEQESTIERFLR
jgi:hypothetical protein